MQCSYIRPLLFGLLTLDAFESFEKLMNKSGGREKLEIMVKISAPIGAKKFNFPTDQ